MDFEWINSIFLRFSEISLRRTLLCRTTGERRSRVTQRADKVRWHYWAHIWLDHSYSTPFTTSITQSRTPWRESALHTDHCLVCFETLRWSDYNERFPFVFMVLYSVLMWLLIQWWRFVYTERCEVISLVRFFYSVPFFVVIRHIAIQRMCMCIVLLRFNTSDTSKRTKLYVVYTYNHLNIIMQNFICKFWSRLGNGFLIGFIFLFQTCFSVNFWRIDLQKNHPKWLEATTYLKRTIFTTPHRYDWSIFCKNFVFLTIFVFRWTVEAA